jgi:hypothetical protein
VGKETNAALASIKYRLASALASQRLRKTINVAPLIDLPCPAFSLDDADPIGEILKSPEYSDCTEFFLESPARDRALVSPNSQALLYVLVRHLKPQSVVEIGSYRASTTEALARAMLATGRASFTSSTPMDARSSPRFLRHGREFFAGAFSFTPSIQWRFSRARRAAACRAG